ncbi:MAG TPA: MFS transporter, partial [Verrucomicrobiae bacterium]|nr:MFS transporter [Verrucomicrobiae bacterium]
MATNPSALRWPRQIKYIVGNEACERFSYYGMRSILAGYITGKVLEGGLGKTPDDSTEIIHLFITANYFMPLIGGWLSDKVLGRYHTILWVSLFYCAGHGVLACSDFTGSVHGKMMCLFIGLALIAFGSGGIKPCVSAFVGDQFTPEQAPLLQKAYGAFYWSINLGSFFSFLVIPYVKDHHGYSAAFLVPGILMAIATFIFWLGRKHYLRVPPTRETKRAGFFKVFWHALSNKRQPGESFWDPARRRFSEQEVEAAKSVGPILGLFLLIPPFWSMFDQTNSTWVLQGYKMVPVKILGFNVGAEEMQSM